MITTSTDNITLDDVPLTSVSQKSSPILEENFCLPSIKKFTDSAAHTQLVLRSKLATHSSKAGLNPLVDAAGGLFSTLGQLKNLKSSPDFVELQKGLMIEINSFQEAAQAKGYRSEYILAGRYALCATFDDVIASTSWGNQGRWDNYSLLVAFSSEGIQQERFFLILERIIKEPVLYIDVMELMYICLSLGYKGSYRAIDSSNQLEKITHSLYKRICAYHGDFSRALSPLSIKASHAIKKTPPQTSYWLGLLVATVIILLFFVGLGSLLDTISDQVYQALGNR